VKDESPPEKLNWKKQPCWKRYHRLSKGKGWDLQRERLKRPPKSKTGPNGRNTPGWTKKTIFFPEMRESTEGTRQSLGPGVMCKRKKKVGGSKLPEQAKKAVVKKKKGPKKTACEPGPPKRPVRERNYWEDPANPQQAPLKGGSTPPTRGACPKPHKPKDPPIPWEKYAQFGSKKEGRKGENVLCAGRKREGRKGTGKPPNANRKKSQRLGWKEF